MKKNKTQITSKSIIQSGLPNDFKKSISEYIWNGFDAGATEIKIYFSCSEVGTMHDFSIRDNGHGISFNAIGETFGYFLDSNKTRSYDHNRFVKGRKGKGRFSFQQFCAKTQWETTFFDSKSEKLLDYTIEITSGNLDDYKTSDQKISSATNSGTVVRFDAFTTLTGDLLESEEFIKFLEIEFGWFLYLNKNKTYQITVNDEIINYNNIIENNIEKQFIIDDEVFDISFILWNSKINEKYYYYFLDRSLFEKGREHTKFNNKTEDFCHSVFVVSKYFEQYSKTENEGISLGFEKNQSDPTHKRLMQLLNKMVSDEEKSFIRNKKAEKLIDDYKNKNIFPSFKNNQYDRLREKDLEIVVKELYCVNPKIFQNLNIPQSKTLVGFLNLLLDSEQRENILSILENIVELTDEERTELSKVLSKTKLSNITALVKLLEGRKNTISVIQRLVFDLAKFTNERDHIQVLVENNYWLFGEQYHLISADENFEKTLNNYMFFLEEEERLKLEKGEGSSPKREERKKAIIESKEKLKRPDIFICRKNASQEFLDDEENIIVELKRPSVVVGKTQYDQIENYIRFIVKEPKFNSDMRRWKLILIGKEVDEYIKDQYESHKSKGKRFLVQAVRNYEIYAYTWDDIVKTFDHRHRFLLDKIGYKDNFEQEFESIKNNPDELLKKVI
ncbi:ATP-binding protein [uncultured Chryseobacterium sp.]|uniref:ATP-binding protein n=1 Tax=Chryseobacterium sp. sg2396 TaxID=3276280 RepID=UPI00258C02A4|nr:ATP-binding protein [uncultured Chryseobacterium sp.]